MSKTELTCLKVLVRDYIAVHGLPQNVKQGLNSDAAKYIGELVQKVAEEKGMVK